MTSKKKDERLLESLNIKSEGVFLNTEQTLKTSASTTNLSPKARKLMRSSSSFVTISRDKFYNVKKVKHPAPPCGYYSMTYKLVDKKAPTLEWMSKKNHSRKKDDSKEEPESPVLSQRALTSPMAPSKLLGFIDFRKQTTRPDITTLTTVNPNEKRFETIYNSASRKHLAIVDFRKTLPRDHKLLQVNMTPVTSEANYEFGRESLGKVGVLFNKRLARAPIVDERNIIQPTTIMYDNIDRFKEKLSGFKRVLSPDFDMAKSRYTHDSILPAFMENNFSRMNLNTLSKQMVESNGFVQAKFQSIQSSFSPKRDFRRTFDSLGSMRTTKQSNWMSREGSMAGLQ